MLLGILIGWMASKTFVSQQKPEVKVLESTVAVIVGGGVTAFLQAVTDAKSISIRLSTYVIGLFVGFFAPMVLDRLAQRYEPDRDQLLGHIEGKVVNGKPITMMRFQTIQKDLGPRWTEKRSRSVVRTYPETFRIAKVRGEPGVGLRKRESPAAAEPTEGSS